MSWIDGCVDGEVRGGLLGELDAVRGHVSDAVLALRRALAAEWVSVAADGYREVIEERLESVRQLAGAVDRADEAVRRAEAARQGTASTWWE